MKRKLFGSIQGFTLSNLDFFLGKKKVLKVVVESVLILANFVVKSLIGELSQKQINRAKEFSIVTNFGLNVTFWRSDIEEILKNLPIGIVPGGSGNGLAKSLAHYNEEDFSCFNR